MNSKSRFSVLSIVALAAGPGCSSCGKEPAHVIDKGFGCEQKGNTLLYLDKGTTELYDQDNKLVGLVHAYGDAKNPQECGCNFTDSSLNHAPLPSGHPGSGYGSTFDLSMRLLSPAAGDSCNVECGTGGERYHVMDHEPAAKAPSNTDTLGYSGQATWSHYITGYFWYPDNDVAKDRTVWFCGCATSEDPPGGGWHNDDIEIKYSTWQAKCNDLQVESITMHYDD